MRTPILGLALLMVVALVLFAAAFNDAASSQQSLPFPPSPAPSPDAGLPDWNRPSDEELQLIEYSYTPLSCLEGWMPYFRAQRDCLRIADPDTCSTCLQEAYSAHGCNQDVLKQALLGEPLFDLTDSDAQRARLQETLTIGDDVPTLSLHEDPGDVVTTRKGLFYFDTQWAES